MLVAVHLPLDESSFLVEQLAHNTTSYDRQTLEVLKVCWPAADHEKSLCLFQDGIGRGHSPYTLTSLQC